MRLGLSLFAAFKLPHRFRGKYRLVKKPTIEDLTKMKHDFEREEQNMLILRHPYLTREQSENHMKVVSDKKTEFLEKKYAEYRAKFQKEITYAEHLGHLEVKNAWD
ncbi:hypothetical protein PUN28_010723 [Cardiocondyla obscurior]|uniref:Ribosomal protein 63, mitochondrial n=1 Tax=Cardiocondyla obscurior TaxID=286306 RepID=A0AAW2FHG6_9HYME